MSKEHAPPSKPASERSARFSWKDVTIAIFLLIFALQMGYKVRFGTDGVTAEPPSRSELNRSNRFSKSAGGSKLPLTAAIGTTLPPKVQGNGLSEDAPEKADNAAQVANDMEFSVDGYVDILDYAITIKQNFICTLSPSQPSDQHSKTLVRACEVCLKVLGGYDPPLNDDAQLLSTVIIQFQLENRLKPDGIVGGRTWKVLKSAVSKALRNPDAKKTTGLIGPLSERARGGGVNDEVGE